MNKENPERRRLRLMTYHIIQRLKNERNTSEAAACRILYNITRQKHKDCGFAVDDFKRFYYCYKRFKECYLE